MEEVPKIEDSGVKGDVGTSLDTGVGILDVAYGRNIAQKVESGEYFEEAKQWYAFTYLHPHTQAFYTCILAIAFVISAYIVHSVASTQYLALKLPFPIYVDDVVNYVSRIKPLFDGHERINASVARYFLDKYVTLRENYGGALLNPDNAQKLLSQVKNLSSRRVFSEFYKYLDIQINPHSPILKYRSSVSRMIRITSIEFPNTVDKPSTAKVKFTAYEKDGDSVQGEDWVAQIYFDMPDIYNVYKKRTELHFVVMTYQVHRAEKEQGL
ncbi:putative type IV secretion system protein [Alphaproteobacteria bacterium]